MRNEHKDPSNHFSVSERQARTMLGSQFNSIIGVLHTHDADWTLPSKNDLRFIPEGWIGGVVIHRQIASWYMTGEMDVPVNVIYRTTDALLYTA
jgi:hypothetical protein